MFYEKLKNDRFTALKAGERVRANFLAALYADAGMRAKNDGSREVTDDDLAASVAKFVKGADETIRIATAAGRPTAAAEQELEWLKFYRLTMLTDTELAAVIDGYVASLADVTPKQMGAVMAQLKANYAGRYDGKLASTLVKQALSK